jgi:pimeloyl-ACP methyl ester carboxylesterase
MTGFASVNGTSLYYEVEGQGAPLVLIHGLGLDTRTWDAQSEALSEHYRVVRYDVRGFGKSALPMEADFRHAEDLHALLEFLDAPKAHIVGQSMGGLIALQHAMLYPDATLSLILADSALDAFEWSPQWNASFEAIAGYARNAGPSGGNEMWLQHELFAPAREQPECLAKLTQIIRDGSGWNWVNRSPARGIRPPAGARLSEIHAPTLVIVGERDLPDFQRIAQTLADSIPNARKMVMKGAGHLTNMENAEEFNSTVLSFLAAINQKGATN